MQRRRRKVATKRKRKKMKKRNRKVPSLPESPRRTRLPGTRGTGGPRPRPLGVGAEPEEHGLQWVAQGWGRRHEGLARDS